MKNYYSHLCVTKLSNSSSSEELKIKHIKDYPYYPSRSAINNKVDVIYKQLPKIFSKEQFIQTIERIVPSVYNNFENKKRLNNWISIWYLRIRTDLFASVEPVIVGDPQNGRRIIYQTKGMWRKLR